MENGHNVLCYKEKTVKKEVCGCVVCLPVYACMHGGQKSRLSVGFHGSSFYILRKGLSLNPEFDI